MAPKKKATRATTKTATKRPSPKKIAAKKTDPGSAIYGTNLGRRDLERFLPSGPPWFAHTFWCSFETTDDLAPMAERLRAGLARIPGATRVAVYDADDPSDEEIVVEFTKKQWALGCRRVGKRKGRFDLDIAFREMGEPWGSNYAIWHMLMKAALPVLGARNVVVGPLDHAKRVWG